METPLVHTETITLTSGCEGVCYSWDEIGVGSYEGLRPQCSVMEMYERRDELIGFLQRTYEVEFEIVGNTITMVAYPLLEDQTQQLYLESTLNQLKAVDTLLSGESLVQTEMWGESVLAYAERYSLEVLRMMRDNIRATLVTDMGVALVMNEEDITVDVKFDPNEVGQEGAGSLFRLLDDLQLLEGAMGIKNQKN